MQVARHPELCQYLTDALQAMRPWLLQGAVRAVALVVLTPVSRRKRESEGEKWREKKCMCVCICDRVCFGFLSERRAYTHSTERHIQKEGCSVRKSKGR